MYKSNLIPSSEITPKEVYLSRREFIRAAGLVVGATTLAGCMPLPAHPTPEVKSEASQEKVAPTATDTNLKDELGDQANTLKEITHYNNFYEFSTGKGDVSLLAKGFKTSPWEVEVSGLVQKPRKFSIDEMKKLFQSEERIYRLRCVEAWSMVIPWMGFPLAKLLKEVDPTSSAKYVRFETIFRPDEMPGQTMSMYPWPYQEGLRIDEAMNDLTLLATGLYGGELPAQNGGGIRLVVPWKYGFKSIKSIIKIELTEEQPKTMWSTIAPEEYGFYANVNPKVDHPRWSQASERRIGELNRRPTLMYNGYADQVASLYTRMDLRKNY